METFEEYKDIVTFDGVKIIKQKKEMRNFFQNKNNKLNNLQVNTNNFFDKFENQVNYLSETYSVPQIKNHFVNYSKIKMPNQNEITFEIQGMENSIDKITQIYLNSLKFKYQLEKDLGKMIISKPEKKKMSLIEQELYNKNDMCENYITEDFFFHKYDRYEKVGFANDKVKTIIENEFRSTMAPLFSYEIEKKMFPEPRVTLKRKSCIFIKKD